MKARAFAILHARLGAHTCHVLVRGAAKAQLDHGTTLAQDVPLVAAHAAGGSMHDGVAQALQRSLHRGPAAAFRLVRAVCCAPSSSGCVHHRLPVAAAAAAGGAPAAAARRRCGRSGCWRPTPWMKPNHGPPPPPPRPWSPAADPLRCACRQRQRRQRRQRRSHGHHPCLHLRCLLVRHRPLQHRQHLRARCASSHGR